MSTIALSTKTDAAEVVIDVFDVEPFRESVPLSSIDLRPGEYLGSRDVSRRFSTCVSTEERLGVFVCSAAGGFRPEGDPSSLPELRDVVLERDVTDCCGESPPRALLGVTGGPALGGVVSVRVVEAEVFPVLLDRVAGCEGGDADPRELLPNPRTGPLRWPVKLSRIALISEGMGTWWTTVTAGQSAAGIIRCSWADGGLQQPGQPGFWYPDSFCGLLRAH